ncbi:MAG: acetate--CoA ligase family protein [Cyanobacteriota bacterium]
MKEIINEIMFPKSIAVIGASARVGSIGYDLMYKIKEFGYKGKIYPINPKTPEILGYKAYKSVMEVPDKVDLGLIAVPRDGVFSVVDQCAEKGIKGVVVISAGFKETGNEGAELEKKLKAQLEKYGMKAVGPNCMGVINGHPEVMMNATFSPQAPIPGKAAFLSQSGALGIAIFYAAKDINLGMSQFVSIGNKASLTEYDFIEYWETDENTDLILLYLESIDDPVRFREACSRISKKKPVIVLKAGTSAAGAAAASSHTGSLAGADKAANALLAQSGAIREPELEKMFHVAQAFGNCPLPKGKKIAILTNGGGAGIMATDATIADGLEIAKLTDETKNRLREFLPEAASVRNPVDTIASVDLEGYERSLNILLEDPNVDAVIGILIPLYLPSLDAAKAMMRAQKKYNKPVLGVLMATNEDYEKVFAVKDLDAIPFYKLPEQAAYALSKMYNYTLWQQKPLNQPKHFSDVNKNAAEKIINQVLDEKRDMLTTLESMDVLKSYGIDTCKYAEAINPDDAVKKADEIGYPVVMKILSKTVSHKSDVGGVIVNIQNSDQLRQEYNNLLARARENNVEQFIDAVMIQEMIKGQREIVIGSATDPQYGSLMMFGLGGIFIEAMEDVVFKVHPITSQDAEDMLKATKSYKLIKGYRGLKGVDMEHLKDQLMRMSQLIADFNYIDELDINPYIITDKTGETMAVDGRIKLKVKSRDELTSLQKECTACK